MMRREGEPKNITVDRQIVFKAMWETPVLVSIQATGVVKVILYPDVAKSHSCMTAKGIMVVFLGRSLYIDIATFDTADVHLP